MHYRFYIATVAGALALSTGCRREPIRVYDVPREQVANSAPAVVAPPAGWQPAPLGEMRVGSYAYKGTNSTKADFGIVSLPYTGERDFENVNRWRSAVGQKALTEQEFAKAAQPINIGGVSGKLYEIAGVSAETDEPTRILGAVAVRNGIGWYFKVTGDDKLVAAQKPAILAFLEKYPYPELHRHEGEMADANDPHAGLPGGGAAGADPHAGLNLGGNAPAAASAGNADGQRSWPVPASWQAQTPGMMQQAKFAVAGGQATVTVSQAGGGLGPNIDRWRGQLGLGPLGDAAEKSATSIDLGGTEARLVDMASEKQRLVVVIVPNGQMSVFYKLMGEPAAVGAEKDALIEFAKKAK